MFFQQTDSPTFSSSMLEAVEQQNHNWKEIKIPANDIIDAYEAGKKAGIDEHFLIYKKTFMENIKKAIQLSEEFYKFLNEELNFPCKNIFLKSSGITSFEVLLVVDYNKYLTDTRKVAYSAVQKIIKESQSEVFSIDFTFMPEVGNLNMNTLHSDGFTLTYEPNKK